MAGVGLIVLMAPSRDDGVTWEHLLAPYSAGAPLPDGFRISDVRRGSGDVVVAIRQPGTAATVEVHVMARGRWPGIRESASFGIGYETTGSSAAQRDVVTDAIAAAVRAHDRGLPSPDAIPLRASDRVELARALETIRGGRGMLIGATIVVLVMTLVVGAPVLSVVAVAMAAVDVGARIGGAPPIQCDIGAPWTIVGAGVLLALAGRGPVHCGRADRALALIALASALALRLGLGPWGPLHVNGYAPRFILGAASDPSATALYGPGYAEAFAPVAALAPASPDWAIFAANALLSALLAPAAFVLARLLSVERRAACAAAVLLAVDPVAIAMASTESYVPILSLLSIGAAALLCLAVRHLSAGTPWRAMGCLGAGALLLVQIIRTHPAGWIVAATVPLVLWADRSALGFRLVGFLAAAALTAGLAIATSGGALLDVLGHIRGGTLMRPQPAPSLAPLGWTMAAAVAYALVCRHRWLALPAGVSAAAMLMTRHNYAQSWLWQQSYDRLFLTLPVIAAAAAVPAALLRRPWFATSAALVLLLAWIRIGVPIVAARTTDQLEYRWVRDQLERLPPECRVVYLGTADKRAMALPTYVGTAARAAVAIDLREPAAIERALAPGPCLFYVRTSLCSSAEGRSPCDVIERRLSLAPIARQSFPALPSSPLIPYDRPSVETVVARVERVDPSAVP